MLRGDGTANFIDFKIKFILIGVGFKNKFNHLLKPNKIIKIKIKYKYYNLKKVKIG